MRYPAYFCYCAVVLFLSCLILSAAYAGETTDPYAIEKLTSKKAPAFTLKTLDGRAISLASAENKVVLLVFWASWCPPCKEEFRSLEALYKTHKERGLEIIAVSSDKSAAKVKEFLAETPVTFPVLMDEGLRVSKGMYKAYMLPVTFILDRRGNISKKRFGEQDWTRPSTVKEIESML